MGNDSNTTGVSGQLRSFNMNFDGMYGWNGRIIHNRDKAWLSFRPKGTFPPEGHMFLAVTQLDMSDPDVVSKVELRLNEEPYSIDIDLSEFDVYSIYRTTCG